MSWMSVVGREAKSVEPSVGVEAVRARLASSMDGGAATAASGASGAQAEGVASINATAAWVAKQMKEREADFTRQTTLTVFCATWNVNGQKPGMDLTAWLNPEGAAPCDVYCIGFQELDLSLTAALGPGETALAAPWEASLSHHLGRIGKYTLVSQMQLGGVFLCVYVRAEYVPPPGSPAREGVFVTDVQTGLAATGIMGVMANKGGVAVRFKLADSSFCVVNCHLNAHSHNVLRRNQDYHDIETSIAFAGDEGPYGVADHDYLFWIGDLNYRLDLEDADARAQVAAGAYDSLLAHDQLRAQIASGAAFAGFSEAPIAFAPTYKYDKDSDVYDSSDKGRTPAWCDRVLWRCAEDDGCSVQASGYGRVELRESDHRPVHARFAIAVRVVQLDKRARIYSELLKRLDTLENKCMPEVQLSANTLDFGEVRFLRAAERSIELRNTGEVLARWSFIPKNAERVVCKPWMRVAPASGILMPGEKAEIKIHIDVDARSAQALNTGADKIDDILILNLKNGRDFFVAVGGKFMKSCFGMPLEALYLYPGPVRTTPAVTEREMDAQQLPKELWRMVDWLYCNGMADPELFAQSGSLGLEQLRECLDTGDQFPADTNVHSMVSTLLLWLESLPEPVVPTRVYGQCVDASASHQQCRNLVSTHLSPISFDVFYYVVAFLQQVLVLSDQNNVTAERLALLFCNVLLRAPGTAQAAETPALIKKKATFVFHFLVDGKRLPSFV
eukprot:m51a1_g4441 putative domain-containing protein (731) ;mRNA; f:111204-114171